MKFHPKSFYKRLALDLFTFSYLMGGINFMDMALLTSDNIIDNRLVYFRKKTKKTNQVTFTREGYTDYSILSEQKSQIHFSNPI